MEQAAQGAVGIVVTTGTLGSVGLYMIKHWLERLESKIDGMTVQIAEADKAAAVLDERVSQLEESYDRGMKVHGV